MPGRDATEGSVWFSDRRCPKCGATLLCNGSLVWCSFVGGGRERACDFGIKERVRVEDLPA